MFVQEGDTINVDVTCPGATLALAMIYLKTNNRWIVSMQKETKKNILLWFHVQGIVSALSVLNDSQLSLQLSTALLLTGVENMNCFHFSVCNM